MKKCFSTLIVLFLVLSLLSTAIPIGATTDEERSVDFNNPAIPANTNETVDLSAYNVSFTGLTDTDAEKISWSSSEITIIDKKVTPTQKGVYKLTASVGNLSKAVYLVVKAPNETDYVLYEDDFSADTLNGYTLQGDCSIADGKLQLNSKNGEDAYILLPSWLGDFGSYSIITDASIKEANDEKRWISLMYRAENGVSPFLQMSVRQNASLDNGIELASNINGSWGYHCTGPYRECLSADNYYSLRLNVFENKAAAYINGTVCASSNEVTQIDHGNVGLRSNGCIALFDSIRVLARFDTEDMPKDPADIRMSMSNITLAPTMIYEIKSSADLENILMRSPSVAIMTVDKSGSVLSSDGKVICSIADAVKKLNSKVIPAVRLANGCAVNDVADALSRLNLKDLMLISSSGEDIKAMRELNSSVFGVLDASAITGKTLSEIKEAALSAGARICILAPDMASSKNTEFLNTLGVTVWYKAKANTEVEAFKLVTCGANGIITENRDLLDKVLSSSIFASNSIIRPVSVVGHRGTPALAPENTVEGSLLAAANGANLIENDVYVTTDGVVVVMHDGTIDRTTNGTGKVEEFSYEELCEYYVDCKPTSSNNSFGRIESTLKIPTLEDYFAAFKGTDTILLIEIKTSQHERLAAALKELIDEYDIADQCVAMSFSKGAITAVRETIPYISVGYLCAMYSPDRIISDTAVLESSYNPGHTGLNKELVSELAARGIQTWTYTVNNASTFDRLLLMGVNGVITDHSYFAKNYVKRISADKKEYTLDAGDLLDIKISAESYGSVSADDLSNSIYDTTDAQMFIIDGNDSVRYTDGKLTANRTGTATAIFRLKFSLGSGSSAYVYSEPVTINVTGEDQIPEQTDGKATNPTEPTQPTKKGGCSSSVSAAAVVAVVGIFGLGFTVKKKDS